jgi:RNA polymerase sigma-70 factor, ECF subfamily
MPGSNAPSLVNLPLLGVLDDSTQTAESIEQEVLVLFDRCAPSLLRYLASLGLTAEETEDILQDVFFSLFRHLRLGRSRSHLKGWLFRVAHNQAMKHRGRRQRQRTLAATNEAALAAYPDPAPSIESQLVERQRQQRLVSVMNALSQRDRQCLFLRAEGLRYRDIAAALGISLGGVAKIVARAMTRLVNADTR